MRRRRQEEAERRGQQIEEKEMGALIEVFMNRLSVDQLFTAQNTFGLSFNPETQNVEVKGQGHNQIGHKCSFTEETETPVVGLHCP